MRIVSFDRIPRTIPHGVPPIVEQYDTTWGFFSFGKTVENQFSETQSYRSAGSFSIQGMFTVDAEVALDPTLAPGGQIDYTTSFARLTARYENLRAMLEAAAKADRPDVADDWYGPTDPRVIALPSPLVDINNNAVYGFPNGVNIEEGRYGVLIRYQATLQIPDNIPAMTLVNDIPLWQSRLSIQPPKPIIFKERPILAEGSLIWIRNYERTYVGVSGIIPMKVGPSVYGADTLAFQRSLEGGTISIKIRKWTSRGIIEQLLYSNLLIDSPSVDVRKTELGASVSIKGLV